jgi:hypothetical protein
MNRTHALALMLFGCMTIGADGSCNPWAGWTNPPPPSTTPPSKPYCYTDPPLGCAAICQDVDTLNFTDACNNIEAGSLTAKFVKDIDAAFNNALNMGTHLCTSSNIGATFTPCMAGITPAEWPGQDHTVCMTAPPGCPQ